MNSALKTWGNFPFQWVGSLKMGLVKTNINHSDAEQLSKQIIQEQGREVTAHQLGAKASESPTSQHGGRINHGQTMERRCLTGAVCERVTRSKVTKWSPTQQPNDLPVKPISVSDATWPVWTTRTLRPGCCHFRSRRGSPDHLTCSVCWVSLCTSWDSFSSSLLPLPHKLKGSWGVPKNDGGPKLVLCLENMVYWRQQIPGCSASRDFETPQVWTASLASCSRVHHPHSRVPSSWRGKQLQPLSLVMSDESCCRSSCGSPQLETRKKTSKKSSSSF